MKDFKTTDQEQLASRIMECFFGRMDTYAVQNGEGNYVRIPKPIEIDDVISHLQGGMTIAPYILNMEDKVRLFCFDVDEKPYKTEKAREAAHEIAMFLRDADIPSLIEFSGYKGYHIWILLDEPLRAPTAINFMRFIMKSLGWEIRPGGDYKHANYMDVKTELFPKEPTTGPKGVGSNIKLPLGKHQRSGEFSYLVDGSFK